MKKYFVLFAFIFCFQLTNLFAQGFYEILGTSHYARAIRLGNSYAGIAEGTEAIYYNVAGLANLNGYSALYSNANGFAYFGGDIKANDLALTYGLPDEIGTIGFSFFSSFFPNYNYDDLTVNMYNLSFGRKLFKGFSAGIGLNYYRLKAEYELPNPLNLEDETGSAFDITLGLLYELPDEMKINYNDKFKAGIQFKNILNSQVNYSNDYEGDYLFQDIRIGASYLYNVEFDKVYNLELLKVLLTGDAVFKGTDYDFIEWNPNFGLEVTLLEILQLSYGRENMKQIKDNVGGTLQFPVNRFGFGLNVPLDYLLELSYKANLSINYSVSDWDKFDESNPPFGYAEKIKNNSFSVGIIITP